MAVVNFCDIFIPSEVLRKKCRLVWLPQCGGPISSAGSVFAVVIKFVIRGDQGLLIASFLGYFAITSEQRRGSLRKICGLNFRITQRTRVGHVEKRSHN